MKKPPIMAAVFILLLAAGLTAFLIVSNQPSFNGSRIKNPSSYTLDIQRMNGTDGHTMSLTAGDVLQVEYKTEKGSLHMGITAPDGGTLYAGNGKEATNFEINIPETGMYTLTVEARNAKGIIHIRLKEVIK